MTKWPVKTIKKNDKNDGDDIHLAHATSTFILIIFHHVIDSPGCLPVIKDNCKCIVMEAVGTGGMQLSFVMWFCH